MRLSKFSEALEETVVGSPTMQSALASICAFAGRSFACDRIHITFMHEDRPVHSDWGAVPVLPKDAPTLFEMQGSSILFERKPVTNPLFVSDLKRFSPRTRLIEVISQAGNRSFALVPIIFPFSLCGWIECYHKSESHLWRREEQTLLTVLAARVPLLLRDKKYAAGESMLVSESAPQEVSPAPTPGEVYYEKLSQVQREYRRLLEYGKFVLFKTNPDFTITDVRGDTERMLGLRPAEVLEEGDIWGRFLSTKARLLFAQKIRQAKKNRSELHDEFKIVHVKTKAERWILFRGVPLFSKNEILGWEALGLDITEKKEAEEGLVHEKRRLQALYEVSHSAQFSAEPEMIALKTLRALKNATRSTVGFIALHSGTNGSFELVAAEGFTEKQVLTLDPFVNSNLLFKEIVELRSGSIVRDLDKRWNSQPGGQGHFKTGLVMPLVSDGVVSGICFLARRGQPQYSHDDFSIVQIACSQVAARIRQAQYHIDERKAADSLGVLYRLSHELSKYLTTREVAEHAVRIISEELPCRRLWLGMMNEQRTHIAGHAGFGPGIRQQIIQLQLELDLRHQFFDEAIESKKPVVVQPVQKMDCSGLERLIGKLSLQTFVIVPLVSLGQVVGVLVFEPSNPTVFLGEGRLPLLVNIASEIGTVLLARRFEAKVADTEKMKMASLLASGVSHNFNNILQAIMGHASLIQMQASPESQIEDSASRIVDAAGKGAALVGQLMTVSSRNIFSRKSMSINKLFQESRDFYKSVLGPEISLEIDLEGSIPNVLADYAQVQQVITNLLLNSREALDGRRDGFVKIQTRRVRLKSGEISTELAPGQYIRIDMEDNGKGMSEEVQIRCFEPFFTTKGRDPESGVGVGGSGLGLSSAYSILRQHAGYIQVKSQEDSGTTFSIFLPLLHPSVEREEVQREEAVSRKKADVHVFSSDEVVISAIRLSLDAFGLVSYVSSDHTDLKEELSGVEPFSGIVVVDLDDPDLRLSKFARSRKKASADLRCIFTGRSFDPWARMIRRYRQSEFIKKPLGAWSLHTAISRLLSLREIGPLSNEIEVSREGAKKTAKKKKRQNKESTTGPNPEIS